MAGVPVVAVSPLEDDSGTSVEQVPGAVAAEVAAGGESRLAPDSAPFALIPELEGREVTEGGGVTGMIPSPGAPGEQGAAPTMSLLKMEEKFSSGQYRDIGDFVSDFRAMLEGYYQLHGADHWLSKQAQKLELMLEQKLSLLSRNLRNKTLATRISKNRYELDEDKESACTSTRRRSSTRNLGNLNTGAMESVMVQVLKQAEFLRAKEEKRIKEQERKEAEEAIQKEMEKWDRSLLALTEPTCMETMWEIPAIGHFLCLAQQILNLPEIVFYELERCLLMPQCNLFLSKIITSLLSPPHRRPTLHRRPNLPYRAWESALRQKVQQWYTVIGQAEKPDRCAEKLGLCSQFFKVLGEVNPLEQKTFHELTFYQKVWLLKGLCDFVYETQSEVQDAVLGQPIHECREVILGYDAQENAYIHFPQFCGADVRVYKQKPFKAPEFPIPPIKIKRTPRVKLNKSKCKYSNKNNGEVKSIRQLRSPTPRTSLEKYFEFHDDCSANCHMGNCNSRAEHDVKSSCEHEDHSPCDINNTACCKENVEKPISPGELVGYGEPLSPGEIRILENVDKYAEATLLKADTSPLKKNALKTYQVHVNGNHTDNTEVICHRVAMDIILDHSLLNHKELKLHKMRTKKKKKKKIKLLNENMQGKYESVQAHTFKSFKTEIHNKLYLNKKRAKHKKHKSGKKSVSKKTVVKKKRIAATSPAAPEFQLVCTNLDELRDLIKKIDGEFKSLENNKKKSGKWHIRRQGVKELHSTLTRLLNELLPWEPKLLKAFQRNRARLRKDYDDFRSLTDSENLTRESCYREDCEANTSPVSKTFELCHQDIQKKDCLDKPEFSEMDVCGKGMLPRKDFSAKESPMSPAKSCKRQYKQCSYADNEEQETLQRKRIQLNTHETLSTCTESVTNTHCCSLGDCQQMESEALEINTDSIGVLKGTKPIQALLAKNIGNKVTLTSHFAQSISKTVPPSESTATSPTNQMPAKSALSCQASSKAPLQMIYKLPDGQCVPIDLQNSPVKIQVQPVIDAKTGDKLMQQFLLLPKNLFIQQKDEKPQSDVAGQNCMSKVPLSISSTGYGNTDKKAQLTTTFNMSMVHSTQCSTLVSQPSTSALSSSTSVSKCETSNSSALVLPNNFPTSVVSSSMSLPVYSDVGGVTSSTDNTAMASHTANTSPAPQKDASEAKQELKTVCIRDSQSILVRTRGGNTGVVTVQPSQGPDTTAPGSIFTITPQLQSFLVSKSKSSASSNFSSVTPSPALSPGLQATQTLLDSGGVNQLTELNTKSAQDQHPSTRCQMADKPLQSSNFLTTVSPSSWLPTNSHAKTNTAAGIVNISTCSNSRQDSSSNKNIATDLKHAKISNISVVQPDSTTPSKSDLVSASSLHKFMLLSSPPILPSGNTPKISMLTTPTSAVTSQKFVFINTQVPGSSSSKNVALQATKQANHTIIGKTYVKPPEQPQIILIPSTMGSSLKMNSPPIVSQVKDVKIGLTIGQTIVNTTGGVKNVLPINILQSTLGKGVESISKDIAGSISTTKGSATCSVVTTPNPVGAQSSATESNGKDLSRALPSLSNRLCSSNRGNAVAISTVKTGHLSSSVLFSTTQMTGHATNTLSSLQIPVATTSVGANSHLGPTTMAATYPALQNELMDKTQYSSERFFKKLPMPVTTPQAALTSLVPTLCKSGSGFSVSQSLPPLSATAINQFKPQLDDSCTHQKLVINTSTPLAPGTQITINGMRLIVPPQGLRAGSHVLLISTNTRQGLSLVGNSVQMCPGSLLDNTTVQLALKQNMSPVQPPGQPFKSMHSFGTSSILPSVQPAPQILNIPSKNVSPCPTSSVDRSSTTVPQPLLVPCIQRGSYPQPSNMAQFPRATPVKEGVIVNTVNPPGNLPASIISDNKMADTTLFVYQSSTSEKPNTVAT
ncbi:putative bromodomain-containing protein 10 [Mixophyes fleayi]|uniref:putative bromodomain-containing protein 10 n=1 Tax=Mixophyes fleayi TaxID=3061075 RepID=UPI003F4DB970